MFRTGYRNYYRHRAVVDKIFLHFADTDRPEIVPLSKKTGVPERTLRNWYKRSKLEKNWRPYNPHSRAEHFRVFSDEEENAIADYIIENYFKPGFLFQDADFRHLAMQAFLEKHKDSELVPDFQCSPGFIQDFKKRNDLSTRRAHYKRRPVLDAEKLAEWKESMRRLVESVSNDRIVNADETAWRILPNGCTTWATRGADAVTINTNDDEKKMVTVMASVTASGRKLPLMVIATGKSHRCEATQLGDIWPHLSHRTERGWMNVDAFRVYLKFLRQQFPDGDVIYLVLDAYSSHRAPSARAMAADLNISLFFVPPGMTDSCQPLDLRVFGALKSIAKAAVYRELSENPGCRIGMPYAVKILLSPWEHLSQDVLSSAWGPYLGEDDEE